MLVVVEPPDQRLRTAKVGGGLGDVQGLYDVEAVEAQQVRLDLRVFVDQLSDGFNSPICSTQAMTRGAALTMAWGPETNAR